MSPWVQAILDGIAILAGLAKVFGASVADLEAVVREADAKPAQIDADEAAALLREAAKRVSP